MQLGDDSVGGRERTVATDCERAFGAVSHFESTHGLVLNNMSGSYVQV